jgi:c-di-GMP-binding flagellar brake protein YcgR
MEVLVTHVTSTGAARFRVRVMDLSGGGARLLCPRPVTPGDLLSVRLPLLDGHTILDVRARAVWVRTVYKSWQAGVEFLGLTDPQRDLIVRTVFFEEVRWRRIQ